MSIKSASPIRRKEKCQEAVKRSAIPQPIVTAQSVDVIVPEAEVREAQLLYKQNRIYDFVKRAVNLWTDWRVFTRLAFVVNSNECTEHGDRSASFVNLTDEIQKPFREKNVAILKSVEHIIHDSLIDHFTKNDSEAILCYALLAMMGIIDNTTEMSVTELLEQSVELGNIEANIHLARLLSHAHSKELLEHECVLPVGRRIVDLERRAAEAGFARVATQVVFSEDIYLKLKYDSKRYDYWAQVAVRAGDTMSMTEVGARIMRENKNNHVVFNSGKKMIERAYELGSPTAAYRMGKIYAVDLYGMKNTEMAMKYFEIAKSWKKRDLNLTLSGTNLSFHKMRDLDQSRYSVDDAIDELQHSIPSKTSALIPDGHNDGHDETENVYFIHDYIRRLLGYDECCDLINAISKQGPEKVLQRLDSKFLSMKDNFVVMTDYWCGVEMPLFQWSVRDQAFSSRFRGDDMPYWGEDWQSVPPPPQMPKSVAHAIMNFLNQQELSK